MAELFRVRLHEAIAEVDRELSQRGRLYAEWTRDGKMSRLAAASRLRRLEAARGFLIELQALKGGGYEHTPRDDGTLAG